MCNCDPTHPTRLTLLCAAKPRPNPAVLCHQAVEPHAGALNVFSICALHSSPSSLGSLPLLLLVQIGLQLRPAPLA